MKSYQKPQRLPFVRILETPRVVTLAETTPVPTIDSTLTASSGFLPFKENSPQKH